MSEWQPIETVPKDGKAVLIWFRAETEQGQPVVAWWSDRTAEGPYNWLTMMGHFHQDCAQLWMPLPKPPGEA